MMNTLQIRLPEEILKQVDLLVQKGFFASRSDLLKEATRRYIMDFNYAGSLPYIIGPFSKETLEILKSDPKEDLFVSREKLAEFRNLIKKLDF